MEAQDKQLLLEAVNALIQSPQAHEWYDALTAAVPLAQRHPIKLSDGPAVLNPLLKLRLQDKIAYERVIGLVDQHRAKLGYDPLVPPVEPAGYDKVEYMREFMEQKRVRQRLAADTENLLRPERDKLVGNHRLEFMRRQSAKWKAQLDSHLQHAREASGGSLTKEQDRAARAAFWATIDRDLERRHEWARRESLKPPHQRQALPEVPMDELLATVN